MLIPTSLIVPAASAGIASLRDVVSSCVVDVDATKTLSYGGSGQTWSNLVAAPADGSAQTAYDFYLGSGSGSGSDDPSFTGTAGSAAAYFALDGNNYFTLKSGSSPSFVSVAHKKPGGNDFWFAVAFRTGDASVSSTLCSTYASGGSNTGVRIYVSSAENVILSQQGDVTGSNSTGQSVTTSQDVVCIYTHSHSTNKTRRWINTTSATEETHVFEDAANTASGPLAIGAYSNGGGRMPAGTRIYGFAMGNTYIGDTEAAAILAEYESRHGRDYTP